MKEAFIDKRFALESRQILGHIMGILKQYSADGFDLSLRQLYYQLVARNLLPQKWADPATGSTNSERSYKNIGNLVSDARLAGLIDWDMIKDRGREMIQNSHWNTPKDILVQAARQFQIDKWETQPAYVEVMVEKQALEGVLEPICRGLDVPFTANKGYSSSSALYEAGKRLARRTEQNKECHIIYLGDHDPSGIDMSRDVIDRLRLFSGWEAQITVVELTRAALNIDQVRQLNPPENPAKMTDSRAGEYVRRFGESSWELDAIEPRALAELVTRAVMNIRDTVEWDKAVAKENKMKEELQSFADNSQFR